MKKEEQILKDLGGLPPKIYHELILAAVDQAEKKLPELNEKIKKKDAESIRCIAHYIKGSAANLRLIPLKKIIESIEETSKKEEAYTTKIQAQIAKLKKELIRLKKETPN